MNTDEMIYKYYIYYNAVKAEKMGVTENPKMVMVDLAENIPFIIIDSEPSILGCWLFRLKSMNPWLAQSFPEYIDILGWAEKEEEKTSGELLLKADEETKDIESGRG